MQQCRCEKLENSWKFFSSENNAKTLFLALLPGSKEVTGTETVNRETWSAPGALTRLRGVGHFPESDDLARWLSIERSGSPFLKVKAVYREAMAERESWHSTKDKHEKNK